MSSRIPPHTQVALEKYKQLRENITKLNIQSGSKSTLEDDLLSLDDHSSLDIRDLKLPQIIYCSRTHSQISQFIHEIRRTCYSSIRCISLASRAHMCINTSINSSKSDYTVSELCLELQRNNVRSSEEIDLAEQPYKRSRSKRATNSCPFHCSFRETQFVRHAFGRIRDIEELVELGSQVQGCPYYGNFFSNLDSI